MTNATKYQDDVLKWEVAIQKKIEFLRAVVLGSGNLQRKIPSIRFYKKIL